MGFGDEGRDEIENSDIGGDWVLGNILQSR